MAFFLKMFVYCITTVVHCLHKLQLPHATKYISTVFDALAFPADSFRLVAYMAVGMMERGLVSFAMLLLNFCFKVDFIL